MAPYDSDSSEDEVEGYRETNVLLGYASKEPTEDTVSQLGGYPTWLDPASPPPTGLARCKTCNDLMVLLLQLNGDLPDIFPGHERRLYVFACRRKACRRREGSVRALRGVRVTNAVGEGGEGKGREVEEEKKEKGPAQWQGVGETLFGAAAPTAPGPTNPFSTPTSPPTKNPFSTSPPQPAPLLPLSSLAAIPPPPTTNHLPTFSSKLTLNLPPLSPDPKDPWPPTPQLPPAYPKYSLDADYESLDTTPSSYPQANLPPIDPVDDPDDAPRTKTGAKTKDDPAYESPHNSTFHNFTTTLSQNPLQVLRYDFRGSPLLYSKTDAVGQLLHPALRIPGCPSCGGERVFECQLTPQAIAELEVGEEGFDGMEWGTVILGVCGGDCVPRGVAGGKAGYLEEWAGVQWEEVGGKGY